MTYLDLINDFWREFENEAMKPNDALLYLYLLKVCNGKNWETPFELTNRKARLCLEITDKAIIESRERLVERGLIEVTKGDRNRASPSYNLLRVCFPHESKTESKHATKRKQNGSKTEANAQQNGSKTEANAQQNGSKNGNIIIEKEKDKEKDKDKDVYYVYDVVTREEFLKEFFAPERMSSIEQLCMARGFGSVGNFRRLAGEVMAEWASVNEPHKDARDARKHLIDHCSRKTEAERKARQQQTSQKPANNGARFNDPAQAKQERMERFQQHILDKLSRHDEPGCDDGFG